MLFGIGMSIASLRRRSDLPLEVRVKLTECQMLCDEGLKEVRSQSYLLHPPLLDEAGLAAALKWFAEGFTRRSEIQVDLEVVDAVTRLSPEIERDLFRIVQEGLSNVARHSGSTKALVRVETDDHHIVLRIKDFGCGMPADFEARRSTEAVGVGIPGMRERLRQVGGRLEISSTDGGGTTLTATIPIDAETVAVYK
jgi:signal transduction histidine kinase